MSAVHTTGLMTCSGFILRCDDGKGGALADTPERARRLSACWNACDGLTTEALERLGTIDRARVELNVIRVQAIAQRDELLAALRRLSQAAGARDNTMGDPCSLLAAKAELAAADRHAMAVIAKITGQEGGAA